MRRKRIWTRLSGELITIKVEMSTSSSNDLFTKLFKSLVSDENVKLTLKESMVSERW